MMDFLSDLNSADKIILLKGKNGSDTLNKILEKFKNSKVVSEKDISNHKPAVAIYSEAPEGSVISEILNVLSPGGKIIITKILDTEKAKLELITKGFMNVKVHDDCLIASKPNFESGSSVPLKLPKKVAPAVWKLDDGDDDDETIDPNELLDEDDLQKPDPASLKVCGTTGKRKACKDCSCGLAEELALEGKQGKTIDTKDAPKSSCGSCYLGDAFRCATCPYLGMPAFKPGEKIQLIGNQLQSDI